MSRSHTLLNLLSAIAVFLMLHVWVRSWPRAEYVNGPPIGSKVQSLLLFDRNKNPVSVFTSPDDTPTLLCFITRSPDQRDFAIIKQVAEDERLAKLPIGQRLRAVLYAPLLMDEEQDNAYYQAFQNASVYLDPTKRPSNLYRIYQTPTLVAIDPRGVVTHVWHSPLPPAEQILTAYLGAIGRL